MYVNVKIPGSRVGFTGPDDDIVPIPVLESREKFKVQIGDTANHVTIGRSQLPLLPSFAMTSYRSQGATMSQVKVDLQSSASIQDAYVMLSRVKTLDGLIILRGFNHLKLKNHINQRLRRELDRITKLAAVTAEEYDETVGLEVEG